MNICNNILKCKKADECPHAQPHEHRDDCCEAHCQGSEVKCHEFVSKNKFYSPFEDSPEYHESFA